jgi:hypothetical protein
MCRSLGGTKVHCKSWELYLFVYGKGNENRKLGTRFVVHRRRITAVKKVKFVSDRMSYIMLKGRWSKTVVLNVHARTEEKATTHFPKNHMEILLHFNASLGRKNIFKPTIGNKSLHEGSNDSGVRVVNYAAS